jgi:hypothetical protein
MKEFDFWNGRGNVQRAERFANLAGGEQRDCTKKPEEKLGDLKRKGHVAGRHRDSEGGGERGRKGGDERGGRGDCGEERRELQMTSRPRLGDCCQM